MRPGPDSQSYGNERNSPPHKTKSYRYTVETPNSGHVGDEHFVHCSEVVSSSEVEMYRQYIGGGKQFVYCREVVHSSECPLSEVPLYTKQKNGVNGSFLFLLPDLATSLLLDLKPARLSKG